MVASLAITPQSTRAEARWLRTKADAGGPASVGPLSYGARMADTTKPRPPTVAAKMLNRVDLQWSGASDNVGIDHYEAWDGATFLKRLDRETRTYATPPLSVGQHKLRVVAYDAAGNYANSNEVEVTILAGGNGAVQSVAATTATQT